MALLKRLSVCVDWWLIKKNQHLLFQRQVVCMESQWLIHPSDTLPGGVGHEVNMTNEGVMIIAQILKHFT